ncbi:CDP-alcohol phosphatidyltransferase [Desulfosarcina widdelii]|uniref:CDP-diacylglycerol--glycerol-3-phosphate 3-phosphatidyltransferase n=1 Tax=Desulfosarcina widdelii TaxID=947919 RepID=A0A5K7ZCG9_9BACT|nr:CDP-alcohol phosphatidyltransferase family protein [Desulfosarcina widdelii]BBO76154.1 CDP-alcohol phosphatidyltransferase [Desulfosarcina widdelii]
MNSGRSNTVVNIPNTLTLARLLMTPLFVILLLREHLTMALVVFSLAGISDGLDGFIARWFNQKTLVGAYLDPVADKVLLVSSFVCLAIQGILPEWLTVIVLSRDVLIVIGIAIFSLTEKPYRIRPSMASKCTTVAQFAVVVVSLLTSSFSGFHALQIPLVWMTGTLTVVSGFHYVYVGIQILQQEV